MRIITMAIVRIRVVHLTHFILQTAVGSMMQNKLPPELVDWDNIYCFLLQLCGLYDSFFCSMWYWLQDRDICSHVGSALVWSVQGAQLMLVVGCELSWDSEPVHVCVASTWDWGHLSMAARFREGAPQEQVHVETQATVARTSMMQPGDSEDFSSPGEWWAYRYKGKGEIDFRRDHALERFQMTMSYSM